MAHPSKPVPPTTESTPPFIDTHMAHQGPGIPAYRFPNSPSPFHSGPVRPTSGRTQKTLKGSVKVQAIHPPPRPTSLPRPVGPDRITRLVDRRRGSFLPRSSWIVRTSHLVAPFVVATRTGTTRMRANDPPLPCSGFAQLEAGFYLEHTPPLRRLKHLVDRSLRAPGTGHHPGSRRGSQVSDGCHADVHVASRCDPAGHCRMSALPQRHSFPSDSLGFRGAETESSPLPFNNGSSRFGSVSVSTYWQALSGLSWLSFSPSAVSADRRVRSWTRSRLSPGRELPTPGALNGHRHYAFRPNPTHGIFTRFNPSHRTLNDTIRRHPAFVCPCRPVSHGRTHRIEHQDYSLTLRTGMSRREGITLTSLRRTGQARLHASGSTRTARRG